MFIVYIFIHHTFTDIHVISFIGLWGHIPNMAELSPVNVQQLLIPFYHSWQHWWFGFLGSPCERDYYLGVSLESQTTGSQTTNSPWVELLFFRWIMNNLDSRVWDIRIVDLNIHLAPYNSLGTPKKPRQRPYLRSNFNETICAVFQTLMQSHYAGWFIGITYNALL